MSELETTAERDRLGELFTALRHADRRRLVRYVEFEDGGPVPTPVLAEAVDTPGVSLLHNHIPHLAGCGILVQNQDTVQAGPSFEAAIAILDVAGETLDG